MDDIFSLAEYYKKLSKTDKNFATKKFFSMSDNDLKEGKAIIELINKKNKEIEIESNYSKRNELNRKKGKLLERLAFLILDSAQIFEIKNNLRDHTNEIDLLLRPTDYNKLNSIILPQYLTNDILIECKNYNDKINVDWVGKFFSLMCTHKIDLGILFSYNEFKGKNEWDSAKGLSKKLFLAENKAIININMDDIQKILDRQFNIVELIKMKYDALKNHVNYTALITKHPAERDEKEQ